MTARWWHQFADARFVIAVIVLGMFAWALSVDPDDATMKGALIAGFAGAWGYFLGSSSGSERKTALLAAGPVPADAAQAAQQTADAAQTEAERIERRTEP